MKRVVAVVIAALLLLAAGASTAAASADLRTSTPLEHAELDRVPGWVTLVFGHEIDPSVGKIVVLNSAGVNVATGALIVEATNVTIQLKDGIGRDTYTVLYRVDDPDTGDITGGSFQFAYGAGTWTDQGKDEWTGPEEEPSIIANPDPLPAGTGTAAAPEPSDPNGPSEPASPDPSDGPSEPGPSASATDQPTTGPEASPSASDGPAPAQPAGWVPLAVIALAGLAVVGGAIALIARRSRGPVDGLDDEADADPDDGGTPTP